VKRAIIFYNGDLADLTQAKKYIHPGDFIICADGGVRHAFTLGLQPNIVIGDFDSSSENLQQQITDQSIKTIKYKTDKDETDSELAINYAIEQGYETIIVFGLLGTRLDHLLTNIFYLANKNADIMIIEGKQEIRVTQKALVINGSVGDLVSLLPLLGDVKNVSTEGLQYKLTGADLRFGYSFGLSDVMTEESAKISFEKGTLLVIHERI